MAINETHKKELHFNLLYKYRPLTLNTIRMILSGEVFFSKPINFNDPFDSYFDRTDSTNVVNQIRVSRSLRKIIHNLSSFDEYIYEKDEIDKVIEENQSNINKMKEGENKDIEVLEKIKKNNIRNKTNIFCLSKKFDNKLMWSHYANNHTGICIGYNVSRVNGKNYMFKYKDGYINENLKKELKYLPVHKVKYRKERPMLSLESRTSNDTILKAFLTKSIDWSYEDEYRVILFDDKLIKNPIRIETNEIKEVIFGLKTNSNDKEALINLIKSSVDGINIFEMVMIDGTGLYPNRCTQLSGVA